MNKPLAHGHAAFLQTYHLLQQRVRFQHHAIADEALHVGTQNARRDQMQDGLLAIDDQRVTRVVPALKAHHGADLLRSAGRRPCPCLRLPTECR